MKANLKLDKVTPNFVSFTIEEPKDMVSGRSLLLRRDVLPADFRPEDYDVSGSVTITVKCTKKGGYL